MAKLSGKIEILVYTDATDSNNPQKRLIDVSEDLTDDTISQWETLKLQILDGVSDQSINLNGITADKFYLKSDQTISIKFNGSGDAQSGDLWFSQSTVSSLTISNSSGSTANIEIGLGS